MFSFFNPLKLIESQFHFGWIQEHPGSIQGPLGIILEAAVVSRDHFLFK